MNIVMRVIRDFLSLIGVSVVFLGIAGALDIGHFCLYYGDKAPSPGFCAGGKK